MKQLSKLGLMMALSAVLVGCQTHQKVAFDPTTDQTRAIFGKKNIFFEFDSAAIRDDGRKIIGAHASYMDSNSAVLLTIEGSADATKNNPYDLKLATLRATTVRDAMIRAGIDAKRIKVTAVVDTEAAKPGRDPAKARKVTFSYR